MSPRMRTALLLSTVFLFPSCGDDGDPTEPVDPVEVVTETLPEAVEGQAYSQQLGAAGGSGGFSWALDAGTLPAGLNLSPGGAITGTPVAPGSAAFRVRVSDTSQRSATADLDILVVQALAVFLSSMPDAVVGDPFTVQLQAVGGRGAYTWSLSGDAPAWLSITPAGALMGTPDEPGAISVMVEVQDESGQEAGRQWDLMVRAPLAVADLDLPDATQGRAYAAQLVATGGDGTYAWGLESGVLPTGMALSASGALTGTPEAAGTFAFTAAVSDGADRTASRALSLTVEPAPTILTTALPPGEPGEAYDAQLAATGGSGAYTWSLTDGALPDGLAMSAAGAITGTPTSAGSATFTVQVTDETPTTHQREFTIVVAPITWLTSGQPLTELQGGEESVRYFAIAVPEGASQLSVSIAGGTGDADLYVRRGTLPEVFAYHCRPLREGNDETCTFSQPAQDAWYVMVRGFAPYADVSLTATHDG